MKRVLLIIVIAVAYIQFGVCQKPNSKFGGVQIGTITYSYWTMPGQSLEEMLNYILQSGISSVELLLNVAESYAGAPNNDNEAILKWRATVSMDKFKEIKKMFNAKGVNIHLLNIFNLSWSDEEIDYAFRVCKALGAKGLIIGISEELAKRMSPFAEKHKIYVVFHNHGEPGNPDFSFDKLLACGPRLMLNLDIGHYYGATQKDPCDIIKRLNKRIFSIHVKDKTGPQDTPKDTHMPFGEGKTPVVEALRLIQKEKYRIYCDIEMEYEIPQGSNAVKEVANCVDYCRKALVK